MELRLAVIAVAARFVTIRLARGTQTVDDMEMRNHIVITPKGRKCMLILQ